MDKLSSEQTNNPSTMESLIRVILQSIQNDLFTTKCRENSQGKQ